MKNPIATNNAPAAIGPYAQGWKAGNLVCTSGQLGIDMETGKLADVLLVEGRPDEDIRVLRRSDHVKLVIQDGRIVKNAMPHTAKA